MYTSINGNFLSSDKAQLALSEGYNFGYGLFETIKAKDGNIIFWKEHIDRLKRGLEKIGLDGNIDSKKLLVEALELIDKNSLSNGALKIVVSKRGDSRDTVITTRVADYPDSLYDRGFSLDISNSKRNPDSLIPYVKSLNYMENIIERNKSIKKGFDDCVFLNTDGFIAETSISNIFFVIGNSVYTPSIETGILDGIVRAKVMEIVEELGYNMLEGKYETEKLLVASEIFLTNSLMGVMPVGRFEKHKFETRENDVTSRIQKRYGEIIYAEINA